MRKMTIGVLLLALFGCDYDVEYTATRLVREDAGCPSAATVRAEEYADEAELARARRQPQVLVCWYRVDKPTEGDVKVADCDAPYEPTLEELKGRVAAEVPDSDDLVDAVATRWACTKDGPVLQLATRDPQCPDALDGRPVSDFDRNDTSVSTRLIVRELVSVDVRPALVMCEYDITDERTRRACNGTSSFGGS